MLIGLLCAGGFALLVCGGIVTALVVMVMPAVQQNQAAVDQDEVAAKRDPTAWRDVSKQHLKQIGLAAHNYHDVYSRFPFASGDLGEGRNAVSFHTAILTQMERFPLYDSIDYNKPWTDPVNKSAYATQIPEYLSPGYDQTTTDDEYAATHFVPSSRFYSGRQLQLADVLDGTSNTLYGGSIDAGFPAWGDPGNPRDPADGFAGGPVAFGGEGGAMMLVADGSVRFINENVSREVAMALATPNGGEQLMDDGTVTVPDHVKQFNAGLSKSKEARLEARVSDLSRDSVELRRYKDELLRNKKELERRLEAVERERDQLQNRQKNDVVRTTREMKQWSEEKARYQEELSALNTELKEDAEYYNEEIRRLAAERSRLAEQIKALGGTPKLGMTPPGESTETTSRDDSSRPADTVIADAPRVPANQKDMEDDLQNLGLAAHNFQDTYGHLPPLAPGNRSIKIKPQSWHTGLLPFIDQQVLLQNIDQDRVWTDPANAKAFAVEVPRFLNPQIKDKKTATGYAAAHYVPNKQLISDKGSGKKFNDVNDGISFTVMAGSIDDGIPAWGDPNNARDFANGVGGGEKAFGANGQGAYVLMADGSVRFVNKQTDPRVIKAIATPDGGELAGQNDF